MTSLNGFTWSAKHGLRQTLAGAAFYHMNYTVFQYTASCLCILFSESFCKMASTNSFTYVKLTEDDVPGAKLCKNKNINEHSVIQLKRWLECRNVQVTGKKSTLVARY